MKKFWRTRYWKLNQAQKTVNLLLGKIKLKKKFFLIMRLEVTRLLDTLPFRMTIHITLIPPQTRNL